MSVKNGRNYIYLIWKDQKNHRQYTVGELSKNGQYEFKYGFEVNDAIKAGFELLIAFEDINKSYYSDILFPTFSSRLPDKKRRGIEKILDKYDLIEFDEYELLKRSGARLPIDDLQFIDPILSDEEKDIKRTFYIAGVRHWIGCDGEDCNKSYSLNPGEELLLVREYGNSYDEFAIKLFDSDNKFIGYIPRYYSQSLSEKMEEKSNILCTLREVVKCNNCEECLKVELKILTAKLD